jgi:hypothetical protein
MAVIAFLAGAVGVWQRWDRGMTGSLFTAAIVLLVVSLMDWAEHKSHHPAH